MRQPDTSALRERLANYTPGQELNEDKQELEGLLLKVPFNIPMHIRCSTMSWHVIRPSRFIRFWIRARRT